MYKNTYWKHLSHFLQKVLETKLEATVFFEISTDTFAGHGFLFYNKQACKVCKIRILEEEKPIMFPKVLWLESLQT